MAIWITPSSQSSSGPTGPASGDLGGTYPNPTVTGAHLGGSDGNFFIRRSGVWAPNSILLSDLPQDAAGIGQTMAWDGSQWSPTDGNGDISGRYVATTVTGIRGKTVSASAPATSSFIQWNGSTFVFAEPTRISAGGNLFALDGNSHLNVSSGVGAPTVATTITGASVALATNSNDMCGAVVLTLGGTAGTAGTVVFTVTLAHSFNNTPYIVLTRGITAWGGTAVVTANVPIVSTASNSAFSVSMTATTGTTGKIAVAYCILGVF